VAKQRNKLSDAHYKEAEKYIQENDPQFHKNRNYSTSSRSKKITKKNLLHHYKLSKTMQELAERLDVSITTVYAYLSRFELDTIKTGKRGTKITKEEFLKAAKIINTRRGLARKFNCSTVTIGNYFKLFGY